MKSPAKVQNIFNTNKLNYKIMEVNEFMNLKPKIITKVETQIGYLQVLEYILQDITYLHVVQYHFINDMQKNSNLPNICCKTYYKEKNKALKFAHEISNNLLIQYE